ncbi:hypothetical protein BGZ65_002927 [Modicella reniformis]|uniref:Uncharacterized protein n=1 Tax=Modicella reniformis TaxID=1440133 RepID=A0A9P6ILA2_9FUNG|nr:hypothetical protein BGZ65_002927 [Modicella reniformis]
MSPTPSASLFSVPILPLPEPPRSDSPVRALKHSLSNGSSHRISIVPRHHDPPKRRPSKPRSRSRSQELSVVIHENDAQLIAARASTPSPRLGATNTKDAAQAIPPSPPSSTTTLNKHVSFQYGNLILPPPPTGQQPEPPVSTTTSSSRPMSTHLHHKHSLSNSSLRSLGSATSPTFPTIGSHGGPVRKHGSRESSLSARLATLAPIPLGSATSVPLPPKSALPPIPLPDPPASAPPALPSHPYGLEEEEDVIEATPEVKEETVASQDMLRDEGVASENGFEMVLEEEERESGVQQLAKIDIPLDNLHLGDEKH